MLPFFILYAFLLFLTAIDLSIGNQSARTVRTLLLIFCGFAVGFLAGFRWKVGTDWDNYLYFYSSLKLLPLFNTGFEIGYELLARLNYLFFPEQYTAMLLSTVFIIIFFTYSGIKRYSTFPVLSVFLLLSYSINSSGFGYRQDIAIAILFWSFVFIEKRKFIPFVLTVLLAFTIHQTSVIFLGAYWIYSIRWNLRNLLIMFVIVGLLIFAISKLQAIIGMVGTESAVSKFSVYSEQSPEEAAKSLRGNPYAIISKAIISRLLFIILTVPFVKYGENEDPVYNGMFNMIIFGVILYALLSPVNIVFSRVSRYFDIFQITLLPLGYSKTKRGYRMLFIVVLLSYSIFKYITIILASDEIYTPYHFFWSF